MGNATEVGCKELNCTSTWLFKVNISSPTPCILLPLHVPLKTVSNQIFFHLFFYMCMSNGEGIRNATYVTITSSLSYDNTTLLEMKLPHLQGKSIYYPIAQHKERTCTHTWWKKAALTQVNSHTENEDGISFLCARVHLVECRIFPFTGSAVHSFLRVPQHVCFSV